MDFEKQSGDTMSPDENISANNELVLFKPNSFNNGLNSNGVSAGQFNPNSNSSNSADLSSLKSYQNKLRRKSTFPFGKCKVCNDKATGVHYGISTCEGCKVSFKLLLNLAKNKNLTNQVLAQNIQIFFYIRYRELIKNEA